MLNRIITLLASFARWFGVDFHEQDDARVLEMQRAIRCLGAIHFRIEFLPDGSWMAESTNIEGIMSGGKNTQHMGEQLKDAIFTYFQIPSYLCRDQLLQTRGETTRQEQRVYV